MGLKYFASCCREIGICFDEVFLYGEGKTYYLKSKNIKRYEFKTSGKQWRDSHQYVIKYFTKDKIFICWNLKYNSKPKRKIFSVDYKTVEIALETSQIYSKKNVEFINRRQEPVYIFREKDVFSFLTHLNLSKGEI